MLVEYLFGSFFPVRLQTMTITNTMDTVDRVMK